MQERRVTGNEEGKSCVIAFAWFGVPLVVSVLVSVAVGMLVAAWAGLLVMAGLLILGLVVFFAALRKYESMKELVDEEE